MDDTWPPVGKPFEQWAHQTYDDGGVLPPGVTIIVNDGAAEPVLSLLGGESR